MENVNVNKQISKIKGKYTKEQLSSYSCREYDISEFDNLELKKNKGIYALYNGIEIKNKKPVILLKIRSFKNSTMKNFLSSTNVFNLKSKYLLPRLGYIIDHNENQFFTVYERPNGDLFDFSSISSMEQNMLLKLYLFDLMAKLIYRIKKSIDNFDIGMVRATLFYFNLNDEVPLKMIDFYYHSYFHLNNNDKELNFMKPYFGMYNINNFLPDDIATMRILLAYIFYDEKIPIDFNVLLNSYYLDINSEVYVNEGNDLDLSRQKAVKFKKGLFDELIVSIPNNDIRLLVQNLTKEKLGPYLREKIEDLDHNHHKSKPKHKVSINDMYTYDTFYEYAFSYIYKFIIKQNKCFSPNCKEMADNIVPYCFEALCKICTKKHMCKAIVFNTIYNLYEEIPSICKKVDTIRDQLDSSPDFINPEFSSELMNKLNIIYESIKYKFYVIKKITKQKQSYFNFIIGQLEKTFKYAVEIQVKNIEQRMEEMNPDDVILSYQIGREIKSLEEFISNNQLRFTHISKRFEIYLAFYEMLPFLNEYYDNLSIFFSGSLEYCIKEVYDLFNKEFMKLDLEKRDIINEMMINEKIKDFYYPFPGTDEMIRIYNISMNDNKINSNSEKIKLTYSKKHDQRKFTIPLNSRYCRIRNTLLICGGSNTYNFEEYLDETFTINLKNNIVKKRSDMNNFRNGHSLIIYNEYLVVAVGGFNSKTVEMYNYLSNQWISLPELNKERANSTLFILNETYLFCFGGEKIGKFIGSSNYIEKYKISSWYDLNCVWKILDYKIYDSEINMSSSLSGIYQKNDNSVFLIGGKTFEEDEKKISCNGKIYEYNFTKSKIRLLDISIDPGYYLNSHFIDIGIQDYIFQLCFNEENSPNISCLKFK